LTEFCRSPIRATTGSKTHFVVARRPTVSVCYSSPVYGQNGDKLKRWQVKTATNQNGDMATRSKPKQRRR